MPIPLLVVDDSAISRKMVIRSIPPSWDVDITQASNGLEALEACREGKAHVMFLDLTMPEMDGIEVLRKLKEENFKSLVIVISADIQPKSQELVESLGALAFIKKPIDSEELEKVLQDQGLI